MKSVRYAAKWFACLFFFGAFWQCAEASLDIYFLRHGQTEWNREHRLQGAVSHPRLTEDGRRMAEETAKGLRAAGLSFDRIYTSPYVRAAETAHIVASERGLEPIVDRRLREMGFGIYEGKICREGVYPDDNIRSFYERAEGYLPRGPGAESYAQVQLRLRDFLESELRPLDGKITKILCVTHSQVLRSLIRELYGDRSADVARMAVQPNCCVHHVRYEDGLFKIVEMGRVYHSVRAMENGAERDKSR